MSFHHFLPLSLSLHRLHFLSFCCFVCSGHYQHGRCVNMTHKTYSIHHLKKKNGWINMLFRRIFRGKTGMEKKRFETDNGKSTNTFTDQGLCQHPLEFPFKKTVDKGFIKSLNDETREGRHIYEAYLYCYSYYYYGCPSHNY